ncbi:MAG: 2-dehydro-3-deoxygalactonokinase [Rhodothalassiaceae bacterium]
MGEYEGCYIAGDWGTSHLRLYLVEAERLIARKSGPGLLALTETIPDTLSRLTEDWRQRCGHVPVLLSGMAGSNIGWHEAPYLPCPLLPASLADAAVRLVRDGQAIHLLPGVCCTSPFGLADFMRGEETQIAGLLADRPGMNAGARMICLPGTHNKWVLIEDGRLRTFFSSLTGELYALLRRQSILLRDTVCDAPFHAEAFALGLERSRPDARGGGLLQKLFETRARRIARELDGERAQSFLSGLLIGDDLHGARAAFGDLWPRALPVAVIAAPELGKAYQVALGSLGMDSEIFDGDRMSLRGLMAASRILSLEDRDRHVAVSADR